MSWITVVSDAAQIGAPSYLMRAERPLNCWVFVYLPVDGWDGGLPGCCSFKWRSRSAALEHAAEHGEFAVAHIPPGSAIPRPRWESA